MREVARQGGLEPVFRSQVRTRVEHGALIATAATCEGLDINAERRTNSIGYLTGSSRKRRIAPPAGEHAVGKF